MARRALALFLGLSMVGGCTSNKWRAYPGPERPADQVATVMITAACLVAVDGVPVEQQRQRYEELQLLPGEHTFEASYELLNVTSKGTKTISGNVLAGHHYSLIAGGFYNKDRLGSVDLLPGVPMNDWMLLFNEKDPSLESGEKWRARAEAGDASAMEVLGNRYLAGINGAPKDWAEAAKWYRKAADAGSTSAMRQMGLLYERGWGVPKDVAEAQRWYAKAKAAPDQ